MSFLTRLLGMPPGTTNTQMLYGFINPLGGGVMDMGGNPYEGPSSTLQNLDSGGTSNNMLLLLGAAVIAFFLMRS